MALAAAASTEHRYQACRDEECERSWCRIYREGYRNGREDEHAVAYEEGFTDGILACPRNHAGG